MVDKKGYNIFIIENKDTLLLDIIYLLEEKKFSNVREIRKICNNRLPNSYIEKLEKLNIINKYNLEKSELKSELSRNGMNKHNLKKSIYYSLTKKIKELNTLFEIYSKVEESSLNRFENRKLRNKNKYSRIKREKEQNKRFQELRKVELSMYSIKEFIFEPTTLKKAYIEGIFNINDFLKMNRKEQKERLGTNYKEIRLINQRIGFFLNNEFGFKNANEIK